jgi:hypothetical protein
MLQACVPRSKGTVTKAQFSTAVATSGAGENPNHSTIAAAHISIGV